MGMVVGWGVGGALFGSILGYLTIGSSSYQEVSIGLWPSCFSLASVWLYPLGYCF